MATGTFTYVGNGFDDRPHLQVTVRVTGGEATLDIHGEVDLATTDIVLRSLERIAADTHGAVVVDLANVTFLDSSGIKAIVRANNMLCALDRRLVLRNPPPIVRRVFAIANLDSLVDIEYGLPA